MSLIWLPMWKVKQSQVCQQVGLAQCFDTGQQVGDRQAELGPLPHRTAPPTGAAGRQFGPDTDERCRSQLPAGGDDPPHFVGLFDHHHRPAAQAPGQDCGFDIAVILVAVADQQSFRIVEQGQGDQQLGLAARLQAEVPAPATLHQLLHHMALLIAFDRKHSLVATFVSVLGDGPLKGGMQPLQTILEDVVEADDQRQGEIPPLQFPYQFHQIKGTSPFSPGLHHHMAAATDAEIGLTPAIETIESGSVGGAPGRRGIMGARGRFGTRGLHWSWVRGPGCSSRRPVIGSS
jgi:hypothetical protein